MSRRDQNRDLVAAVNEALQAQLQEATAEIAERKWQLPELQEILQHEEYLQHQFDDTLLRIDDRDQQLASLRVVYPVNPDQVTEVDAICRLSFI